MLEHAGAKNAQGIPTDVVCDRGSACILPVLQCFIPIVLSAFMLSPYLETFKKKLTEKDKRRIQKNKAVAKHQMVKKTISKRGRPQVIHGLGALSLCHADSFLWRWLGACDHYRYTGDVFCKW